MNKKQQRIFAAVACIDEENGYPCVTWSQPGSDDRDGLLPSLQAGWKVTSVHAAEGHEAIGWLVILEKDEG